MSSVEGINTGGVEGTGAGLDLASAAASGSCMDQMLKLFEPPGGYATERDAELHPYFKRPGRGHNHDSCDSCKEGGALICCDSCPASFHLHCHDPPLEDEDIPEGDWMCIKCFAAKPLQKKLLASTQNSPPKREKELSDMERLAKMDKAKADKEKADKDKPFKAKDNEWKPKKKDDAETSRPTRATRLLKQAKYNDNSTEEEFSESDLLEPIIPQAKATTPNSPKKVNRRRTYLDIYQVHLKLKPRQTSSMFQVLLEAANTQNAEEFVLPKNIHVPEKFPYAWKWSTAEQKLRTQRSEDGYSKVKLALCYVCIKSSRVAPLVQCDFCPCHFHMDCLDPPLAEIPSDVWMCPNHVESLLDSKLTSNRLTERIHLWEKFATQPIDTHIVKTQFMKKCSRLKRTCSMKATTVASKKRVKVPEFVKNQYRRPVSLLPGPGYDRWVDPTHLRAQALKSSMKPKGLELDIKDAPSEGEEEISHENTDLNEVKTEVSEDAEESKQSDVESHQPPVQEDKIQTQTSAETETSNKAIEEIELRPSEDATKEVEIRPSEEAAAEDVEFRPREDADSLSEDVSMEEDSQELSSPMDKSTESESEGSKAKPSESLESKEPELIPELKPKSVTLFDSSSLEQSMDSVTTTGNSVVDFNWRPKPTIRDAYSQDELEWVSSLVSLQTELLRHKLGGGGEFDEEKTSLECNERMPSQDRFEDLPHGARSPNSSTVSGISYSGKVAAEHQLMEQLQDYLITHSEVDNMDPIVLKYLAARQINKILPNRTTLLQSNVRSRASLTPVGSRVQPFYMQYRTLDIGTGPEVHLNLRDFGHCNNLSARHANLFYDELSGQYELINYSHFGTKVDECMYSLDTAVVMSRFKAKIEGESKGPVMAAPGTAQTPCYCAPLYPHKGEWVKEEDPLGEEGCEGSALLHHGSIIKFGCLEFVFSVAAIHGI